MKPQALIIFVALLIATVTSATSRRDGNTPKLFSTASSLNGSETNYLQNETESIFRNVTEENVQGLALQKGEDSVAEQYVADVSSTKSPVKSNSVISPNMTALANYKGEISASFLKKINPHWLYFPPQSASSHYILAAIYFIMSVLGLTGNGLVIFIYLKCSSVRTPANNLILNLAVSDFLIMLEGPIFVYNAIHQGPAAGELACKLYGMLGAVGGTVAIVTLCFISIDRYNVIVYPLNPSRGTTNMRSYIMIIFIWAFSLPFCLTPLLGIGGVSGYIPEGFLTACSFDYLDTSTANYWFIFCYAMAAYFLPLSIISYCYFHILHVVISAKKIQSNKGNNKTEVRLAAIVMGIISLWCFAWTPYCVVALVGIFGYANSISPLASMIPAIMAKMAACGDPYLYAVTHPRFRTELEKIFCSKLAVRSQSTYSRRADRNESDCETIQLGDDYQRSTNIKRTIQRAESSFCEETVS